MVSSLSKLIQIVVLGLAIASCHEINCEQLKIQNLGTVQFRLSYANLIGLTDHELDSIPPSKPEFDLLSNDAKPELLKYLDTLGFVENGALQLKKVDTLLRDTVKISTFGKESFYLFASLDLHSEKTYLNITSNRCKDSVYLDNSLSRPLLRLVQVKNSSKNLLLVFWKFYFMNGDMFDIALFEIP